MKWLRTIILFNRGDVVLSADWDGIHKSLVRSIKSIDFPEGSGKLLLRRRKKDANSKQWNRNGVKPLRTRFLDHMVNTEGWRAEGEVDFRGLEEGHKFHLYPSMELAHEPITSEFGDFDFITKTAGGLCVAIEWETGNISSSHRSLNKLCIMLAASEIQAGILIVPSRDLYEHLTDRIGNIGELSPYLSMWKGMGASVDRGVLAIIVVEHDELTDDPEFPYLSTGLDGRAVEGKGKRG